MPLADRHLRLGVSAPRGHQGHPRLGGIRGAFQHFQHLLRLTALRARMCARARYVLIRMKCWKC